ncbi:MAG TPA: hypothetical protein VHU88_22060 [Sporichthyaceae bacterium]|jgi:hypothetical protein|nr:hypothetical protein [Sporichthyaceae bacterium]
MAAEELLGTVDSEFARVRLSIDHAGNGPRLRIEDLTGGRVNYLDALTLEALAWVSEEKLRELLDPSADRWRVPES